MFRVELLPAGAGDCIWVQWGDARAPYQLLVDAGPPKTCDVIKERLGQLSPEKRRFELIIASHIDQDHIGGLVRLLEDPPVGLTAGDVWLNGFRHLPRPDGMISPRQAEEVTQALLERHYPWNEAFDQGPIQVSIEDGPPRKELAGGMVLTVLSPYQDQLKALYSTWHCKLELLRAAAPPPRTSALEGMLLGAHLDVDELAGTRFRTDHSVANGSSIAVLAEYEGRALLLAGDATDDVLVRSLDRLAAQRGNRPIGIRALKVSHHGSRGSTSRPLLRRLRCANYLISTDGSGHQHPARETIARILEIRDNPEKYLCFNYRSRSTGVWDDSWLKRRHSYKTRYPTGRDGHLEMELA